MNRADYLPVPHKFNLSMACNMIAECFGRNLGIFLVGSALEKRDYRDVDVRCILDDAEFYRLFPNLKPQTTVDGAGNMTTSRPTSQLDATWSLLMAAISLWLQNQSLLPVDFQIQSMSEAAEKYDKQKRNALGLYYADAPSGQPPHEPGPSCPPGCDGGAAT